MSVREQELIRILREFVDADADHITPVTKFAELGLDSLAGLRFTRKVQDAFGIEIELEWLFDYPSVAELACFLDQTFGALTAQPVTCAS